NVIKLQKAFPTILDVAQIASWEATNPIFVTILLAGGVKQHLLREFCQEFFDPTNKSKKPLLATLLFSKVALQGLL
ncbi:MAG: hypothetical protein LUH36_02800, partial [Oscillospiraceae bacterium]|nr:hypothetical protein [Oscillospiraceae bacterium]